MISLVKSLLRRRRERRLARLSAQDIFTRYYRRNSWGDPESVSGKGSNLAVTEALRAALPDLLRRHEVGSILDVPCGDFNWMQHVDLGGVDYLGGDIVADLIAENQRKHAGPGRRFAVVNLISDSLPKADLIFTRDCLVHLSFADGLAALANIKQSGARYLLATNFPATRENADILTGQWRAIDLCKAPYNFPPPREVIDEKFRKADGSHSDKSMALWAIADLPLLG
ncbi:MAG: class I SAM-dependent methyltransferase [Paracoccaceae bacterium]